MDFRELNYILAIAKYQNITKAAQSLYIGQPTLSKFLSALEHDLGQPLFRKLGNRYVLTYAGERYVQKAREIIRLKGNLDAELADIIKQDVGVLNVALPTCCGTVLLPKVLPAFRQLYPNIRVNILEGNEDRNVANLLDGSADLAFFARPEYSNPLLEYETLCSEEVLICTCRDHPLSRFSIPDPARRYPTLDPTVLQDETVLLLTHDHRIDRVAQAEFEIRGLKFAHTIRTGSLSAILDLVSQGYGISFLGEAQLRSCPETHAVDCFSFHAEDTSADLVVSYRKGSYLSRYTRDYIDIVRDFLNSSF